MLFVLHADHEQNCSTSTVRLVGSSHANLFASVSAGINALFGPLHGGANQSVLEMLEAIKRDGGDIPRFVERVKNKEPGVKLMGFGHRVYKNYDPRAAIVKATADTVLDKLGGNNELLDLARQLEEIALKDDYFVERKLYPNVDFYTGLIYRAMGFPTRMFTVLFALGRLPGWIAQWREMIADPSHQDRPAAAALHRRDRAGLRPARPLAKPRRDRSAPTGPGSPPPRRSCPARAVSAAGPYGGAPPRRTPPTRRTAHGRAARRRRPRRAPDPAGDRQLLEPEGDGPPVRITKVEFVVSTEDGGELRIPLVHRHGAWWAP